MASYASFLADPTQAVVFARATQAPARTLYSTLQSAVVAIGVAIPSRIEGAAPMYKINAAAKVPFKAVDSSGNGLTGLTITAKTAKDGANPTTCTNAVQESGQGWYYITLTATEMNGEIIVLDATAAGATIAPIAIHTEADYTTARAAHLDADISSRSTYAGGAVASVTAAVTVGTNNDKTGYALSSAGVQAVWDALTSALTTAGSIGKRIVDYLTGDAYARLGAPAGASIAADIATRSTYAGADTSGTTTLLSRLTSTRAGNLDNLDAAVSTRSTYAGADTSGTTTLLGRLSSIRAGNLDNLDATVSSRSTYAGGAVASVTAPVTVGTNSDKTGYALTSGERTAIANEVEAQIIDETDSEKVLTAITDKIASVNPSLGSLTLAAIAAAVRDQAYAGASAGSIGAALAALAARLPGSGTLAVATDVPSADIAAIKAKTDNLPSDPADASDIAGSFSTVNGTLATIAGYIDTEVAAIKAKTDNLPAAPASSGDVSTVGSAVAAVDAKLGAPAGASVAADVAAAKADTAAIKTKTDSLTFTVPGQVDANIHGVNDVTVTGSGAPSDPWGPP